MDGSPSRGETIPIRLFLGGFDLTPTFRDVNKKFSTRYYLSLVLIDEGEPSFYPCMGKSLTRGCAITKMRGDTSSSLRSFSTGRRPRLQPMEANKTRYPHRQRISSRRCLPPRDFWISGAKRRAAGHGMSVGCNPVMMV